MIGFITVGTNDLPRAVAFYDALFASLGGARVFEDERIVVWGFGPVGAGFCVCKPYDGQPATVGNGVMVALAMSSKSQVDDFYRLALKLGAKDEGAPGPRNSWMYSAFFRDLDGHKIEAYYMH